MKKFVLEFLRRGLIAAGIGPIVLAIVYLILQQTAAVETLSANQVCIGIFSITALTFIAGGMNAIYQIERMPLMIAILIHGAVLYMIYLVTYLLNNWLEWGVTPILVFTAIFVLGYLAIWVIICFVMKKRTEGLNEILKKKQESAEK